MNRFNQGDRVFALVGGTWMGATVNYARMAPGDRVEAYSVIRDDLLAKAGYEGTVVAAALVISPEQHAQIAELEKVEQALQAKGWSMEEP